MILRVPELDDEKQRLIDSNNEATAEIHEAVIGSLQVKFQKKRHKKTIYQFKRRSDIVDSDRFV